MPNFESCGELGCQTLSSHLFLHLVQLHLPITSRGPLVPPMKSLAGFMMLQALWVDRLGLYIYSKVLRQTGGVVRVPFLRPVSDERDARSTLTMLGQTAWEEERQYKPIMLNLPEPAGVS